MNEPAFTLDEATLAALAGQAGNYFPRMQERNENDPDFVENIAQKVNSKLPKELQDFISESRYIINTADENNFSAWWITKELKRAMRSTHFEQWIIVKSWPWIQDVKEKWLDQCCVRHYPAAFVAGFATAALLRLHRQTPRDDTETHNADDQQQQREEDFFKQAESENGPSPGQGISLRDIKFYILRWKFENWMDKPSLEDDLTNFYEKLSGQFQYFLGSIILPTAILILLPKLIRVLTGSDAGEQSKIIVLDKSGDQIVLQQGSSSSNSILPWSSLLSLLSFGLSTTVSFAQGMYSSLRLSRVIYNTMPKIEAYTRAPDPNSKTSLAPLTEQAKPYLPMLPIHLKVSTVDRIIKAVPPTLKLYLLYSHFNPLSTRKNFVVGSNNGVLTDLGLVSLGVVSWFQFKTSRESMIIRARAHHSSN